MILLASNNSRSKLTAFTLVWLTRQNACHGNHLEYQDHPGPASVNTRQTCVSVWLGPLRLSKLVGCKNPASFSSYQLDVFFEYSGEPYRDGLHWPMHQARQKRVFKWRNPELLREHETVENTEKLGPRYLNRADSENHHRSRFRGHTCGTVKLACWRLKTYWRQVECDAVKRQPKRQTQGCQGAGFISVSLSSDSKD